MPSSRNRDWSRKGDSREGGGNPALWNPSVVRIASTWAIVMGVLGILGTVLLSYQASETGLAGEPMVVIVIVTGTIAAVASLYFGFVLRTPAPRSRRDFTVLIWIYGTLLALAIVQFILLFVAPEQPNASSWISTTLYFLALLAFIRGRREMDDFPETPGASIR